MRNLIIFYLFLAKLFGSNLDISERLNYAIQPPSFSEPELIFSSGEEIVEVVRPILRKHLESTNYDRIFPVLQFLDHYENCKKADPAISPLDAYKSFKFVPLVPGSRGGACVSLTFDVYHSLSTCLKGYIAIAKLPGEFQQIGFPKYSHTAVLIKYQHPSNAEDRGYVLLESGFDIAEPILLKSNGDPFFYRTEKKGLWKFFIDDDKIICEIINENNKKPGLPPDYFTMVYSTKCVLNPIEASAMPMILADRRLSLLSRREDGSHRAHLNIELNKTRVIWDKDGERFDPVSFSQFFQNGWTFPGWFANNLHINNLELTNKVLRVIKNKAILDSLYIDYMRLLKETKDFTITGELDFDQIDKTLEIIRNNAGLE